MSAIKVLPSLPYHSQQAVTGTELLGCHHGQQSAALYSPQDGGVDDVWPVGGSDDEDVLLAPHAVHLCEDLIDDSVRGTSSISASSSSGLGDGVQLVEEEDTGGS